MIRKTTRIHDFTDEPDENPFLVAFGRNNKTIIVNHEMGLNLIMTTKQAIELSREIFAIVEERGGPMSCDYEMSPEIQEIKRLVKRDCEIKKPVAVYGCYLDVEMGWVKDPVIHPDCVIETGKPDDCSFTDKYEKKEDCKYWREIEVAATPEPMPTGEGERVIDRVVLDLKARDIVGKIKYGTSLKTNNGRNSLMDAYQEALDMCMYLKQRLMEETKTIRYWQKECHENAVEHGWWEEKRPIPELLCLIHSEVSEALEAYRKADMDNFREELADIAIRLFDLAGGYAVDLEYEIENKHKINKTREYRHGGKVC